MQKAKSRLLPKNDRRGLQRAKDLSYPTHPWFLRSESCAKNNKYKSKLHSCLRWVILTDATGTGRREPVSGLCHGGGGEHSGEKSHGNLIWTQAVLRAAAMNSTLLTGTNKPEQGRATDLPSQGNTSNAGQTVQSSIFRIKDKTK